MHDSLGNHNQCCKLVKAVKLMCVAKYDSSGKRAWTILHANYLYRSLGKIQR